MTHTVIWWDPVIWCSGGNTALRLDAELALVYEPSLGTQVMGVIFSQSQSRIPPCTSNHGTEARKMTVWVTMVDPFH